MGWRFNKRFKVAPGVTVNVSKSGPSVSLGTRGARLSFGRKGVRDTVGIPGTGLSYTNLSEIQNSTLIWIIALALAAGAYLLFHYLH
jgi:Protein of unknown function (DUF4236)